MKQKCLQTINEGAQRKTPGDCRLCGKPRMETMNRKTAVYVTCPHVSYNKLRETADHR